jgi:hypothetical protein
MKILQQHHFNALQCRHEWQKFNDLLQQKKTLLLSVKIVNLDANEANRLKWRENKVMVNSTPISCVTFNQLNDDIDFRLKIRSN